MTESWHGTLSGYSHHGCRCEACGTAMREYSRQRRQRLAAEGLPVYRHEPERARNRKARRRAERVLVNGRLIHPRATHGVRTSYTNWACRCVPCTDAWRQATNVRRLARRASRVPDANGFLIVTAPVQHGRPSTYHNWGCQCRPCMDAAAVARNPAAARRVSS